LTYDNEESETTKKGFFEIFFFFNPSPLMGEARWGWSFPPLHLPLPTPPKADQPLAESGREIVLIVSSKGVL